MRGTKIVPSGAAAGYTAGMVREGLHPRRVCKWHEHKWDLGKEKRLPKVLILRRQSLRQKLDNPILNEKIILLLL